jgi:signal peptidase I
MDSFTISCTSDAFLGLSQEIMHKGKSLRFLAQGTSMHPLVRNGDILMVDPVKSGKIRVGDVVLCTPAVGSVVVHRVIRTKKTRKATRYLVQGDQASQPDGWISQEQVTARLSAIERDGRQIDMYCFRMRILSWFAVLRSKWQVGHKGFSVHLVHMAKKLPIFTDLLS